MGIGIFLEIRSCTPENAECLLALGNSTSVIGWLFCLSKLGGQTSEHTAHLMVARNIAQANINSSSCLASHHLKDKLNFVANLLLFAGGITRSGKKRHPIAFNNPPDDILTQHFHTHYSAQILASFKICRLPDKILSLALLVLQTAALSLTAGKKAVMRATTASGANGVASALKQESILIPSSLVYPQTSVHFLSRPSSCATTQSTGSQMAPLMEHIKCKWARALCGKPQATWLGRFSTISNQAPFTSKAHPSCSPQLVPCCALLRMSTLPPIVKRPSPQTPQAYALVVRTWSSGVT